MTERDVFRGLGLSMLVGTAIVVAAPPPPPPPLARTVRRVLRPVDELITSLDAASFAERRGATRDLYETGRAAAVPLGRAARQQSLEVAARAVAVLERMYTAADLEVAASSEDVLEGLAVDAPPRVARRARAVLSAHTRIRQRRAVQQVRRLGGIFKDLEDNVVDPNSTELLGRPIVTLQLGRDWKGGDKGLRYVRRLSQLRSLLLIAGAPLSDASVDSLKKELPLLVIVRRGRALLGVRALSMPCQIREVRPGLAADRAGIRVEDVVTMFDGQKIDDFQQLVDLIKKKEPGQKVPIYVTRSEGGVQKSLKLVVTLDDWDDVARREQKKRK